MDLVARRILQPVRRVLRRQLGRNTATRFRNHDGDPVQPTRSAITVAGINGNSTNKARTRGSNASNADGTGARTYAGGRSEASALETVSLASPSRFAIARTDMPSLT